jgi:hypothetical protein
MLQPTATLLRHRHYILPEVMHVRRIWCHSLMAPTAVCYLWEGWKISGGIPMNTSLCGAMSAVVGVV